MATYDKQIILTIEICVNLNKQIRISIKHNNWGKSRGKFNKKTKRLTKIIKITSYFLIRHLVNKKLLLSTLFFIELLNSNILRISQLVKNNRN